MKQDIAIEVKDVTKVYPPSTKALDGVSIKIMKGEWAAIMGPSGSGKTTLLNIISCLDRATEGTVKVLGKDISKMSDRDMTIFRRNNLGMIFQQYHLIPYLSALENVEIAQFFHSMVDRPSAKNSLIDLGLKDRLDHVPAKLSGGEQQRVAIARALINEPSIILADEPTGNLDQHNGKKIMEILKALHKKGQTIVFVTHDPQLARWADRTIEIMDGKIATGKAGQRC
jgi:putative ABC transport system ATP-binding protein